MRALAHGTVETQLPQREHLMWVRGDLADTTAQVFAAGDRIDAVAAHIGVGAAPAYAIAGDSGSLLVTDPDKNPVGLLFAGDSSGKFAIANQIDDVLDALGVTVDGP